MFIILSKILPLLIYPVSLAAGLLAAALYWGRRSGWARPARRLAAAGFLVLFLGGNRYVALSLVRFLESRYPPLTALPQVDAIVILGGTAHPHLPPRPIVELNEAGDRLLYGAWLYQQGVAGTLLLAGGNIPELSPVAVPPEAESMRQALLIMGVPDDALLVEAESRNTYENALFSRELLFDRGIDRIVLVTSASHMPRAVALYEAQGFSVIPAPTDYMVSDTEWAYLWSAQPLLWLLNLVPDAHAMFLTTRALKEYVGWVVYDLRGWL